MRPIAFSLSSALMRPSSRTFPSLACRYSRRSACTESGSISPPCFTGQRLGIKEVDEGIWLVSFTSYDLGFIDLEQKLCSHIVNVYFLELRNGDIYVGSTNNLPRILNPVLEKSL